MAKPLTPAFVRLAVRNFRAALDFLTMFVVFGQPIFIILVLGVMLSQLIPHPGGSASYLAYFVPGMISTTAITGSVLTARILWLDRRFSMVEQILSGPFRRVDYLGALFLTSVAFALVEVALLTAVGVPLAGLPTPPLYGFGIILGTICATTLLFSGLLVAIAARTRSSTFFFTIQSVLQSFLVFVSNVYYPVTPGTPAVLRTVISYNPLSYAADILRDSIGSALNPNDVIGAVLLVVLAVAAFVAAVLSFRGIRFGPIG